MGDIVEIKGQNQGSFKVSSNAIRFEVKGLPWHGSVVQIGRQLAQSDYTIILGEQNCDSYIQTNPEISVAKQRTPNILSPDEYRGFWISWFNNVSVGRDGETIPFMTAELRNSDANITSYIKYVWFDFNPHIPTCWRVEVPPKILKTLCTRTITGGKMEWKKVDESLPDGALIGGYEDETLYIIRARHRLSHTPGKFMPSVGEGFIPWGGQAVLADEPEVLCGFDCVWVPTSGKEIPLGAIEGGFSEVGLETLYVGRAHHAGHLVPGKVQPTHKCCYIPYHGQEIVKKNYEILVDPNHDSRTVNTFKPRVSEPVNVGPPTVDIPDLGDEDDDSDIFYAEGHEDMVIF